MHRRLLSDQCIPGLAGGLADRRLTVLPSTARSVQPSSPRYVRSALPPVLTLVDFQRNIETSTTCQPATADARLTASLARPSQSSDLAHPSQPRALSEPPNEHTPEILSTTCTCVRPAPLRLHMSDIWRSAHATTRLSELRSQKRATGKRASVRPSAPANLSVRGTRRASNNGLDTQPPAVF